MSNTSNDGDIDGPLIITEYSHVYTGSEFLCQALASAGVTHIFGGHGGAVVSLINAIIAHPTLTWVYCRCEVNASQAAAAHAKLTGRLGCCVATSGPGATHLLSGLIDADQDRVPLLCLTGMKSLGKTRHSDFQDIDQTSVFRMAGLALSEEVAHIDQLLPLTRNAFTAAITSNRCAHLAIPVNVQAASIEARTHFCLGTAFQQSPHSASSVIVEALVMALRSEIKANRHVMIACGYRAHNLGDLVERIAELMHAPVLTSFDGKGTVDEHHPLSYGVVGVYGNVGTPAALDLMEHCETVIGICVNDWSELIVDSVSGLQVRKFVQIDETLVGGDSMRFAPSAVLTCGFLRETLQRVVRVLEEHLERDGMLRKRALRSVELWGTLRKSECYRQMHDEITIHEPELAKDVWSELKKETYTKPTGTPSTYLDGSCLKSADIHSQDFAHPAVFFKVMSDYLDNDSTICADIGDNSLFMASCLVCKRGQRYLTSEHMGILGYSLNAGLASSLAAVRKASNNCDGDKTKVSKTLVVAGDGGIQMSLNELATMRDHVQGMFWLLLSSIVDWGEYKMSRGGLDLRQMDVTLDHQVMLIYSKHMAIQMVPCSQLAIMKSSLQQ